MIDSIVLRPWNEVASPRRPPAGLGYISINGHSSMAMVGSREIVSAERIRTGTRGTKWASFFGERGDHVVS